MIESLTQLKKTLQPGVAVTLIATSMPNHKYLGTTRKVSKAQTNAIQFEGGSWLYYGKAKDYKFTDNGFVVNIPLKGAPEFSEFLEYAIK